MKIVALHCKWQGILTTYATSAMGAINGMGEYADALPAVFAIVGMFCCRTFFRVCCSGSMHDFTKGIFSKAAMVLSLYVQSGPYAGLSRAIFKAAKSEVK
jgi:hypothetical protein